METGFVDLPTLDRDVQRAALREERLRAMLAGGEVPRARAFDPWDGLRHVAGQTTWRTLRELEPSPHDVLLRDALLRWVHEELQARLDKELAVDDAEAVREEDPDLLKPDPAIAKSYVDAWRRVLVARDGAISANALTRAGELADRVASIRRERRARRFEVARRLGLAHPEALAVPEGLDLPSRARALLDATEPLAKEILRAEGKRTEGRWHAPHAIHLALAKDARDGWPAKLGARWLDDVLRPLAPRGVPAGTFEPPLGGASFLRAAARWGHALRASGTARSLPFALARDPYPRAAFRMGAVMAAAIADPVFHKRALALPARLAAAQARSLRTSLFLEVRTSAARLLLAWPERTDTSVFEELTSRVFGAPLPLSLAGAWPAPRVDEAARLLAVLDAPGAVRALVDRFDEDWFRNPKAGAHLASIACAPMVDAEPPAGGAVDALARAFEEMIG